MDISKLSLTDLKKLKTKVDHAISTFEERRLEHARAALEAKAKELGVSLAEVMNASPKRRRSSPNPKYVNPENPEETWSGRGRSPVWMKQLLDKGHLKEEFEMFAK